MIGFFILTCIFGWCAYRDIQKHRRILNEVRPILARTADRCEFKIKMSRRWLLVIICFAIVEAYAIIGQGIL